MMKKLKRWAAFVLCCALVLSCAACGAGGGSSSQPPNDKGRYVETDITPPGAEGETLSSFLAADGTLVCYTAGLEKKYTSADGGESWQESAGPGAEGTLDGTVGSFTLLPDGTLLAALNDETGSLAGLVKIAPDGTVEPFHIPALDEALASGDTTYINQLKALSQDRLFLGFSSGDFGTPAGGTVPEGDPPGEGDESSVPGDGGEGQNQGDSLPEGDDSGDNSGDDSGDGSGGFFVGGEQTNFSGLIDLASGESVAEYPDWFGVAVAADGETLYMLDYNGEILAKSLQDGSAKTGNESKLAVGEFNFSLAMGHGQGSLYVLDGKTIQKLAAGAAPETLVDGSGYSFADPGSMPTGLHVLPEGDIVLNLAGQNGARLYRYTWDENATLDPNKILKVWSLYENYLVRAAISQLRKQDPAIIVEYEVALGEDDSMTAEDAIKNLNTRLMNGDGPDVMILDGCPADSYAARGMLQDLTGLVDTSGMFQNLLTPFTGEDGTFYLPMNVKIPVMLGTGEMLAKADTLKALAEWVQAGNPLPQADENDDVFAALPENERPVLAPGDLEELFNLLWDAGAGAIITEKGLDTEALENLLAPLLSISEKYALGSGGGGAGGAMAVMSGSGGAAATVTGSPLAYSAQRALLGAYTADDLQMLKFMMDPPGSSFVSFPGLVDGSFTPSCLAGISADSGKTELAAQFISTMLGQEVQGTRTGSGFPVTAAGMEKQIADIDEMMREYQNESFEFDYESLMALAKTPQMTDAVVKEAVWSVVQRLCEGELDLEGAVKQIEQDLKNYLAERQ